MKMSNVAGVIALGGALLSAFPVFSDETVTIDGINWTYKTYKTYNYYGDTVAEITCIPKNTSGGVVIPSQIGTYAVRRIAAGAFENCTNLTSVTIDGSETSIGEYAFAYCSGLTSVTIGNGVTSIGSRAFYGCSGLESVNISDIAAWCRISFEDDAESYYKDTSNPLCRAHNLYLNGSQVKQLNIPSSVTSIGFSAFSGCSGLTSVTIPNSVTNIGSKAFYGCSGLTSVTIPDSVTIIGGAAFSGCSGLTSVTIPDSVTIIGSNAFSGCSGLTSVTIPSRYVVSSIFSYSYSRITSVAVSQGSTSIANGAFKGCVSLSSISIPDSVTSVGDEAFYNCSSLSSLTIPGSVTHYGVNCFEGCPAYTLSLYRMVFSGDAGGGGVSTIPYALTAAPADRAIVSVTVNGDYAIGGFVLKDGKVYDSMLRIVNTASRDVKVTLPSGYAYETFKGATPLTIPAKSCNMLSITRTADKTFLVTREELETVQ